MAIKKSELYSSLWAGCDELRGSMDARSNLFYSTGVTDFIVVTDRE
jgi:type I restriction enzyme M protein